MQNFFIGQANGFITKNQRNFGKLSLGQQAGNSFAWLTDHRPQIPLARRQGDGVSTAGQRIGQ